MLRWHRCLILAVIVSLAGCGGGGKRTRSTVVPGKGSSRAREFVEDVVAAQWATLARPDLASFVSFLSPDVLWFGSGTGEAMVGSEAVAADLDRVFAGLIAAGASFETRSAGVRVGVGPDGRAGWAADDVVLTIITGGERTEIGYRVTSLVAEQNGKWWIIAQHWSIAVTPEQARARAATSKGAPAELADGVEPAAAPLLAALDAGLAEPSVWLGMLSRRADTHAFTAGQRADGNPAVRTLFAAELERATLSRKGGVRAALAPGGQVGFVASNLELVQHTGAEKLVLPLRSLLVYLRDGKQWRLVQAHLSHGQSPD